MRNRWRWALPVFGLLLFGFGSYEFFTNPPSPTGRYLWWSSIRLDRDRLGRQYPSGKPVCKSNPNASVDCASTEPTAMCVYPGWLAKCPFLTCLPAFLLGIAISGALGILGISQVWSFMISMPVLIPSWFYLVGWRLDRRRSKRQPTGK
jgi:hypothetical protein